MKLTKHRDGDGWRVHADGEPSPFVIVKGSPPKFREPQEWEVYSEATDRILITAKSAFGCMQALEELAEYFEGGLASKAA